MNFKEWVKSIQTAGYIRIPQFLIQFLPLNSFCNIKSIYYLKIQIYDNYSNYLIVASRSTSRLVAPNVTKKSKNKSRRSLRYSGFVTYTSCFSSSRNSCKQKSFFPKKNCGMLVFETLKNKNSDFLNSNTCFCLRLHSRQKKVFATSVRMFCDCK